MQHQPVITIFSFGFQQQEDILSHSCCALFYWPAVARSGLWSKTSAEFPVNWGLCNHYQFFGLCLRILLVSDSINLSEDYCSWSVFLCFFEPCICYPVGLKGKEMAHVMYCQCVAILLVLECNICCWQVIGAVLLSEGKPRWSHSNHTFLNWASGNSALGMVLAINTGQNFNACSFVSSLPTHMHTHLHSYCIHIRLIIPVTNPCKPISGCCVDWFPVGVAGKGKRPHWHLPRASLCGALVRFRTRKTV